MTTSLEALPLAGQCKFAVFDKTGTLTVETPQMKGVLNCASIKSRASHPLVPMQDASASLLLVLVGCHGLTGGSDSALAGDPLDLCCFEATAWKYHPYTRTAVPPDQNEASLLRQRLDLEVAELEEAMRQLPAKEAIRAAIARQAALEKRATLDTTAVRSAGKTVKMLRRFPFESSLQRLTTVVELSGFDEGLGFGPCCPDHQRAVLVKGSWEKLGPLLESSHDSDAINAAHDSLVREGFRALTLAAKLIPEGNTETETREDLEAGLKFCGFVAVQSEVRDGTSATLRLLAREHKLVMLTGDSPYTAHYVGKQVGLCGGALALLEVDSAGAPSWRAAS